MMILRRKRIALVRGDLIAATLATVDAGIGDRCAWVQHLVERGMRRRGKELLVLEKRHLL
jgi:hypothetical protein